MTETKRLYYEDVYKKEFTAKVLECREAKKGFHIILDESAFYPEGGGQPSDAGYLNDVKVKEVHEKDGELLHYTDQPMEAGTEVQGRIDWARRFDLMQQHSGEHMVSGLIHEAYGYDNVGFHMGSDTITVDLNGPLDEAQLAEIERKTNEKIWEDTEVKILYPTAEELEKIDYRSKKELTGQVRIVEFPGVDICACCAPHVDRTGEIGNIKLVDMVSYKGGEHITMLSGSRALTDYEKKQEQNRKISALLCAKEYETAEAVGHLKEELDSLKRTLVEKERQLVHVWAQSVSEEEKTVCMFSEDISADAMRQYVNEVLEKERILCAVFYGNDAAGYRYVIGSRTQDLRAFSKMLNAAFEGRGGGKPEMVQGTVKGEAGKIREWIQKIAEELSYEK